MGWGRGGGNETGGGETDTESERGGRGRQTNRGRGNKKMQMSGQKQLVHSTILLHSYGCYWYPYHPVLDDRIY